MADLSIENALSLFINALTKNGKSINTIVAYKGDLNQLITFLKIIRLLKID
jgi:site-specific recombinase XerD